MKNGKKTKKKSARKQDKLFTTVCPKCFKEVQCQESWVGKTLKCPECSKKFTCSKETEFDFVCPECDTIARIDLRKVGQIIECEGCSEHVVVFVPDFQFCPVCKGKIKKKAKICKHCKVPLSNDAPPSHGKKRCPRCGGIIETGDRQCRNCKLSIKSVEALAKYYKKQTGKISIVNNEIVRPDKDYAKRKTGRISVPEKHKTGTGRIAAVEKEDDEDHRKHQTGKISERVEKHGEEPGTKLCSYCEKVIKAGALVCRYCGHRNIIRTRPPGFKYKPISMFDVFQVRHPENYGGYTQFKFCVLCLLGIIGFFISLYSHAELPKTEVRVAQENGIFLATLLFFVLAVLVTILLSLS